MVLRIGKEKSGVAVDEEVVQEVDELVAESADLGASGGAAIVAHLPQADTFAQIRCDRLRLGKSQEIFIWLDEREDYQHPDYNNPQSQSRYHYHHPTINDGSGLFSFSTSGCLTHFYITQTHRVYLYAKPKV